VGGGGGGTGKPFAKSFWCGMKWKRYECNFRSIQFIFLDHPFISVHKRIGLFPGSYQRPAAAAAGRLSDHYFFRQKRSQKVDEPKHKYELHF